MSACTWKSSFSIARIPAAVSGLRHEQVCAEGQEPADRVGSAVDDGAVEILGRAPPVLRRAERALREAQGLRALRIGDELTPRDVADRNLRELDVPSPAPQAAGQRVEAGDGPIGLRGVGVLPDPGPRVVGDRAGVGEQLGRGPDVFGRDAGNGLQLVAGEPRAPLAIRVEHGAAADRAVEGRHRHLAFERPWRAVQRRPRRDLRAFGLRVPDHEHIRGAAGHEVALAQQPCFRAVHEEWGVGEIAHEVAVVPSFLHHHAGNPERERTVGARPHPQPHVRLVRGAGPARIDDHELRAPRARIRHLPRLRDPGGARVVPPQQRASRVLPVRVADARAVGVGGCNVLVPVADLGAVAVVRAAERVHQALHPLDGVRDRGPARGGDGERDGLGAGLGRKPAHLPGDGVERLVPRDPDPSGIGIALGTGALHRVEDAVRALHLLGRGLALRAERAAGRVGRVALDPDQAVVADHRDAAAPRSAQCAPSGDADVLRVRLSHRAPPGRVNETSISGDYSPGSRKWACAAATSLSRLDCHASTRTLATRRPWRMMTPRANVSSSRHGRR